MFGFPAFLSWLRFRIFRLFFIGTYRFLHRHGSWRAAMADAVSPRSDEHIIEVSAKDSVILAAASKYPGIQFSSANPPSVGAADRAPDGKPLNQDDYSINYKAASFDKVVCSLALHSLPPSKKLALLRECVACFVTAGPCL